MTQNRNLASIQKDSVGKEGVNGKKLDNKGASTLLKQKSYSLRDDNHGESLVRILTFPIHWGHRDIHMQMQCTQVVTANTNVNIPSGLLSGNVSRTESFCHFMS